MLKIGKITIEARLANGNKQTRVITGTVFDAYTQCISLFGQCLGCTIDQTGTPAYVFRKKGTVTKVSLFGKHVVSKFGFRTAREEV